MNGSGRRVRCSYAPSGSVTLRSAADADSAAPELDRQGTSGADVTLDRRMVGARSRSARRQRARCATSSSGSAPTPTATVSTAVTSTAATIGREARTAVRSRSLSASSTAGATTRR